MTTETVVLRDRVFGLGYTVELPFAVPEGVNRVAVSLERRGLHGAVGVGLFDGRGAAYQSPGFRGVYGAERSSFHVSASDASEGFLPGPIEPGTWTVVVPVFRAFPWNDITVTVTLTHGPAGTPPPAPSGPVGVVRAEPGWYRGDLHAHTPASSDAWASGSALTPAGWAEACRRGGLDFVALTDHNVVAQNADLAAAAGEGVLLMGGEEMTNWFHGHAVVAGLAPGAWLDWRQRPRPFPLQPHEARVTDFVQTARALGAYTAAAHPFAPLIGWQFFREGNADPAARPDAIEVWNGRFAADDARAVEYWDRQLQRGVRVVAGGGSDLHGTAEAGRAPGVPTTVVHADELATPAVVAALREGRSYLTRHPAGVAMELTAEGAGGVVGGLGDTVHGPVGSRARASVRVRRGAGMTVRLIAGGQIVRSATVANEDDLVTADVPLAAGYVRAEVRGLPDTPEDRSRRPRLDMEALSNPIWLAETPV